MIDDRPAALAGLRALLFADEDAALALAPIVEPDRFAAAAVAFAARHGLAIDMAALDRAVAPDRLGLGRFAAPAIPDDAVPPRHWLPVAVTGTADAPHVEWLHFAGEALDRPFYEDSVRRARALPFNRLMRCVTPLAALAAFDAAPLPDGLIFHMSRCGSTLVAQMLASLPGSIVVSEPPPLDSVIQLAARGAVPPAAIRHMAAALTRDRSGRARHRFIKLDSWHALALPMLRALFADTPWLFLHRDPVEVLVSQQRMPGFHAVPGLIPLDAFGIAAPPGIGHDAHLGWLLGQICDAAADGLATGGGIAIDYRALPDAVVQHLLPHFGVSPDAAAQVALAAAGQRNAKVPDAHFAPDTAGKQQQASPELRALAALHIAPACARLRRCQGS